MKKLTELYCNVAGAMCEAGFMPDWIPFVGSLKDKAIEWAVANPEQAEKLATDVYRFIKEYRSEQAKTARSHTP